MNKIFYIVILILLTTQIAPAQDTGNRDLEKKLEITADSLTRHLQSWGEGLPAYGFYLRHTKNVRLNTL